MRISTYLAAEEKFASDYLLDRNFLDCLRQRGIELGSEVEGPDFQLYGSKTLVTDELRSSGPPIILFDTCDDGRVEEWLRPLLAFPRVVRVLKQSSYVDHNCAVLRGRRQGVELHTCKAEAIGARGGGGQYLSELPEASAAKIRVWCGLARRGHLRRWVKAPFRPYTDRTTHPFLLHAAMNLSYPDDPAIESHRVSALYAASAWAGSNHSCALIGSSFGACRSLSAEWYHEFMGRSQCVLSPWGWSEFCHRDNEALLSGCVLLKPATRFATTWPELVAGEHYIPCLPDFSDLSARMVEALDPARMDYERRRALREHVLQAWNPQTLADRFVQCVEGL